MEPNLPHFIKGMGTGIKYSIYYHSFCTWCMWERTCKQAGEFQHQKIAAAFDKLEKPHQQLTSLAWWHGGQWQVPVTQMKPHLRTTQATNTSAQLSNAPEPEWMSGWASKFIEAFFRKELAVWRRRPTSPNHSPQPGAPTLEQLKALSGSLGITPAKGRWQVHCAGWPCTKLGDAAILSHTSEAKQHPVISSYVSYIPKKLQIN